MSNTTSGRCHSVVATVLVERGRRAVAHRDRTPWLRDRTPWLVGVSYFAATLLRGTGDFRFDAFFYWLGAQDLLGTIPAGSPEFPWSVRSVLTAVVYTPAAAFTSVTSDSLAPLAVLAQNAAVLAWVAGFLIPMVVRAWRPMSSQARWGTAALAWVLLSGFARYPLVDIYPAIACLALVVLVRSRRWYVLLLGGVVAGVALNLRPSYLLALAGIAIVALLWRGWRGLLLPVGAGLALVPQVAFNAVRYGIASALPLDSNALLGFQTSLATYTVRYDTVFNSNTPQLFYCSPEMAQRLGSEMPTTTGGFAGTMLENLPTSLGFALEKIGASLHWPLSTPYTIPSPGLDLPFALLVTAVSVIGCAILVRRLFLQLRRSYRQLGPDLVALVVLAAGSVLTIVGSASESRFALALVLVGLVGCASVINTPIRVAWRDHRWAVLVTGALLLGVIALGYAGLDSPLPQGVYSVLDCAAL